jgi:hypothetical protein
MTLHLFPPLYEGRSISSRRDDPNQKGMTSCARTDEQRCRILEGVGLFLALDRIRGTPSGEEDLSFPSCQQSNIYSS